MLTSKLYTDARIHGPYLDSRDKRWYVNIYFNKDNITRLSLARFNYQELIGRILETWEQVDHKDNNKLNDDIGNLQILTQDEHNKKTHTKYSNDIEVQCFFCPNKFILTPKQQRERNRKRSQETGPFCSSRCAAKYGRSLR